MAQTIKRPFRSFNGTDWDKHYFETSADQVKMNDGTNVEAKVTQHLAEKATQTTLGHVKAGKNVTIQTDGTLDVDVDNMIKFNRNPTVNDIYYNTGQLWFNEDTGSIYVLLKIDKDGSAIWRGVNNAFKYILCFGSTEYEKKLKEGG